jgi:hypothetical protein
MRSSILPLLSLVALLAGRAVAADKKPAITLPKDPKAIVLSYDPGANGFVRKGAAPYLKIQADGQVTVINVFNGAKKEGKLTAKELDDLLRFVIVENDVFNVTAAKIEEGIKAEIAKGAGAIAVGGAGTGVINVQTNDKKHEVSYRGASAYLQAYPKVKPLEQFVAIEKRLSTLGTSIEKGK